MKLKLFNTLKALTFLILLVASFITITNGLVNDHEEIHQIIYEDYGIESEVTVSYLGLNGGKTTISLSDRRDKCTEFCRMSHNINDVIGWHINYIVYSIFSIFLLFIIYDMFKYRSELDRKDAESGRCK